MVLSIDNTEQGSAAGREPYRRAVRDLVAAATRVGRDADILGVSESEYYVLLPETDHFGALMFLRRAVDEVRREDTIQRVEERCPVLLSMGAATFPKDGEDFDELLHWARARIQEQRGSLVRRLHLDDLDPSAFWELGDLLVAARAHAGELSVRPAHGELLAAVQREAARARSAIRARDALRRRSGRRRGTTRSCRRCRPATPPRARAIRPRASTCSGCAATAPRRSCTVTEVYLDGDKRFDDHAFALFLSEHSAYALLAGPGGRVFHTSDAPLVDALVAKLQNLYDLQPL